MKPIRALCKHRWLLALSVVAVLIHVFASPLMARATDGEFPAFGGAICTAQGTVDASSLIADGEGPGDSAPAAEHRGCDLCGTCNAPALQAPDATRAPLRDAGSATPCPPASAPPALRLADRAPPPRGPPARP